MAADAIRRLLDIVASLLGLILLSPLFVLTGLLIKLDSPGPVFYRAKRTGLHGSDFYLVKFRTMVVNADKLGPAITTAGDRRITRLGYKLRRTKLDELPQLINVLKRDLSLVGPRPEDPRIVAQYTPDQRRILEVRPGITSPASLTYHNEEQLLSGADWETTYLRDILPAKLTIDLAYFSQRTLSSDIAVIIRTVMAMLPAEPG